MRGGTAVSEALRRRGKQEPHQGPLMVVIRRQRPKVGASVHELLGTIDPRVDRRGEAGGALTGVECSSHRRERERQLGGRVQLAVHQLDGR